MASVERGRRVSLTARNIGGIEETEVEFQPGVTVLAGRNATHRTSLLQAIMAALGSERVSLRGNAEEGHVRMEVGGEVYTRDLRRENGRVRFGGDPYLDDPQLADLFAFLLESNDARRSVALGDDLREIIMEPVDVDAIQSEINSREAERDELDRQVEQLEEVTARLPELEADRRDIEDELAETRERLAEKRGELEAKSREASEARAEQSALDEKMEELQRTQSALDRVEFQIESQRDSLDTLANEREELAARLDEMEDVRTVDPSELESEIQELRKRKQTLSRELSKLQNVIQFNEEMLDGTSEDIAAALRDESAERETITDQLLAADETVVCWTCGTEVDEERIEGTIDRLRDLRQSKYSQRNELDDEIEELAERREAIENERRERERIEEKLADVRAEIEERETRVEELRDEREEREAEIERLEAEIERLETEDRSDVLEAHREVNRLEVEVERLEDDRDRVAQNIAELESRTDEIDELTERRETLQDELADLRTRIEQIERSAVEEFNDHMETVLDILAYENIDRVWIERVEREVQEGRRTVSKAQFDLHVVRSTPDGVTYEDDFEHLSESEREVTGLVFALAGYLVHDVYETLPFILLDSLEAIDAKRIANLVDYLREYADYLVVALLTEDARAIDESYEQIENI